MHLRRSPLAPLLAGLATLGLLALPVGRGGRTPPQRPGKLPQTVWDEGRARVAVEDGREVAAGEALVELEDWSRLAAVEGRLAQAGAKVIGGVPGERLLRVRLPRGAARAALARVARLGGVRAAEWNALGHGGALPPDDTFYPEEWHLENTGQGGGTPGADVGAPGAWAIQEGDPSVVCAVIDSGLDPTHPELVGRTLPGWDFVDEDADPDPESPHGVFVATLLGANTSNRFGIAGMDRRCTILPLKVLDGSGYGTTFDLIQALDRCVTDGVDVACMSLIDYPGTRALKKALQRARDAGVILVACAGNGGPGDADASWPGASPLTISIGCTDRHDQRWPDSATGSALDFVAPGVNVVTASPSGIDTYALFTGCSAATPLAAGIVSLLKAEAPELTQDEALLWLRAGAADLVGPPGEDTPGWDPAYGAGRLSAAGSLRALCSCTGGEDLRGSPPGLSAASGGTQLLRLDAGPAQAGRVFWLVGSATGTTPGIPVNGVVLPLVYDGYLLDTLRAPNRPPLLGGLGVLDATGRAVAELRIPPGSTSLAGLHLWHAYLVLRGPKAVQASRAVEVRLE